VDDAAVDADPIADGRKVGRARRVMAEAAADLRPALGVAGDAIQPRCSSTMRANRRSRRPRLAA
jgi:hypothetical protein